MNALTAYDGYERAVAGALLVDAVPDDTPVPPELLKDARHRALLEAAGAAREAGVPRRDPAAFMQWLIQRGLVRQCGGKDYLADLVAAAALPMSVSWYLDRLDDGSMRQGLGQWGARITQAAENPDMDIDELESLAAQALAAVRSRRAGSVQVFGDLVSLGLHDIEMRPSQPAGLTTGFPDLDALFPGGHKPGAVVTIAAPTSVGKTTLALDIARHLSVNEGVAGAMATLEMTAQQIFDKVLSAQTGIPLSTILTGDLSDSDWAQAGRAAASLGQTPLAVHSGPISLLGLRKLIAATRGRLGRCDYLVIDYFQLMSTAGIPGYQRQEKLAELMRCIKQLAIAERIVIYLVAQCNRAAGVRTDKVPVLSDLRETGEIENSSDVVLMLHSEAAHDRMSPRLGETDVWVRKNRFGPRDVAVPLAAQLHRSRFAPLARAA